MPAVQPRAPSAPPMVDLSLPESGAVANGGVVAAWHREIEARLTGTSIEMPADKRVRLASRAMGYTALLCGYGAIAWFFLA